MRAPFQVFAIPYRLIHGSPVFCVFHRADMDRWQFIAGGGEDDETPLEAAKRETAEEGGVSGQSWIELKSLAYIPAEVIQERHRRNWPKDTYVIPNYPFAFACEEDIRLSHEHRDCVWLGYEEAAEKLSWESDRIALYELRCRLEAGEG